MSMDFSEVRTLLHIEDLVRNQPFLGEIKASVLARLKEINGEVAKDNQAKVEAQRKADAEAAHLAAVKRAEEAQANEPGALQTEEQRARFDAYQAEPPIYPAGSGTVETSIPRRV